MEANREKAGEHTSDRREESAARRGQSYVCQKELRKYSTLVKGSSPR